MPEQDSSTVNRAAVARKVKLIGGNPIPLKPRSKEPVSPGWTTQVVADERYDEVFAGDVNVGSTLGPAPGSRLEGQPATGLYDIDADTPEARTASRRLRSGGCRFGRTSARGAHELVIIETPASEPITRKVFTGLKGEVLVEGRGEGHQTMMPGSDHPIDEVVEWESPEVPRRMTPEQFGDALAEIAAVAMLGALWAHLPTQRHNAALALVGALLHGERDEIYAERILLAVCDAGGDGDPEDRLKALESTVARFNAGHPVAGMSTLSRIANDAGFDGRTVAGKLRAWLKLKRAAIARTDLGNGERLVERHSADIRYCPGLGWFVWDGRCWRRDEAGDIYEKAKETARSIYLESAEAAKQGDDAAAKELSKWAAASQNMQRIDAMIKAARTDPEVRITVADLDCDRFAFNVHNGTIDLRTGGLRPHTRGDLITKLAPVTYDATAACPIWGQTLKRILPDPDVRGFVQRYAGMALSGDTREKVLLLAYGGGDNGKTTFVETIQHILGDDYAAVVPESTIAAKRDGQDGIPNDIARLRGSRLVVVSETTEGVRLNEGRIKALTGRNKVSARFMRGEWFDFWPEFKLIVETNHRPMVKGTDNAIWNRLKLVPFTVTIPKAEQDKGLPAALRSELPGILNWLVRGCLDWLAKGLGEPEAVIAATGEFRGALDVIGDFIADLCEVGEGNSVAAGDLYRAYTGWVINARGEQHPMSMTRFGELMIERGFTRKETKRGRVYVGIGLRLANLFNDAGTADVA